MKTTRTYLDGCKWCDATGIVSDNSVGLTDFTSLTKICPVCNGTKVILVTEIIEAEDKQNECDICHCRPSIIVRNEKGTFCQKCAK